MARKELRPPRRYDIGFEENGLVGDAVTREARMPAAAHHYILVPRLGTP